MLGGRGRLEVGLWGLPRSLRDRPEDDTRNLCVLLLFCMRGSPGGPTSKPGSAFFWRFWEAMVRLVQVIWEPGAVSIPASLEATWNCIHFCFLLGNVKTRYPPVSHEPICSSDIAHVCMLGVIQPCSELDVS